MDSVDVHEIVDVLPDFSEYHMRLRLLLRIVYTECNFDDNETECSGDCSWFPSDYPTTSLSPIMVDNCDTTYRDAIAEWGGVGTTISGTVGRVLGELGVTTGASTEEIEDNTIDALQTTSLVLGGG